MKVTGITIVRDAVRLDFPILEAVRSILPLVDEMIVNVGTSTDGTLRLLEDELDIPGVKIVERRWDDSIGGAMLAAETQAAIDMASGDWIVYVQADEVLHESSVDPLKEAMYRHLYNRSVEGLLVDFVHHYCTPDKVATSRRWYRREARVIRSRAGVESFDEAQGFRVDRGRRKVRVCRTEAVYHHYGWSRPRAALATKRRLDYAIYGRRPPAAEAPILPWQYGIRSFRDSHPALMKDWIHDRRGPFAPIGRARWDLDQVRLLASDLIEKCFRIRLWEYRNYVIL